MARRAHSNWLSVSRLVSLPRAALRRVATRWAVVFGGGSAFALLAFELTRTSRVAMDEPVMHVLRHIRSSSFTRVMLRVTAFGDGDVLAMIAIFGTLTLWVRRHPRSALYLALTAAGAGLMNGGLKLLFARERPDVLLRLAHTQGFAFPSGHSMASAAVYGALAIIALSRFPRTRIPITILCSGMVFTIGFSRAYLHVHFPSDVLAGWALGMAWPLALKPVILGKGYSPETAPADELRADGARAR